MRSFEQFHCKNNTQHAVWVPVVWSEADIWSFVFEKRGEEPSTTFSLHSQRLAPLKSHRAFCLPLSLLLPLLLSLLHLLHDHQPHVLLSQQGDAQLGLLALKPLTKPFKISPFFACGLTCQASSSWESATLCLMVLRSCWVSSSFSWRTVASSLSNVLNVKGSNIKTLPTICEARCPSSNEPNREMLPVARRSRPALERLHSLLQRRQLCFCRLHLQCAIVTNQRHRNRIQDEITQEHRAAGS